MRSSNLLIKAAICCASFFLYMAAYQLNELFDSIALYATGISLVYIPAGFKLLCLLIGGEAAAVGLLLSSLYLSTRIWDPTLVTQIVYFAVTGVSAYYIAVVLVKKFLHINNRLNNLRYLHIIVLSAAASVLNGVMLNIVFVWQNQEKPSEFLSHTAAMVLGDFLGCFIVIMFFNVCITLACKLIDSRQPTKSKYGISRDAPNGNNVPVRHGDR